jgi:hypothetical protein
MPIIVARAIAAAQPATSAVIIHSRRRFAATVWESRICSTDKRSSRTLACRFVASSLIARVMTASNCDGTAAIFDAGVKLPMGTCPVSSW